MKYLNFVGNETLKELKSTLSYVEDLVYFEDEYGYYVIIEDSNFKSIQLICREENIKIMISHNRDELCKYMLQYCNYTANEYFHVSDLVLKQLMLGNSDILIFLRKMFSNLEEHLVYTAFAYLLNNMNSIKTAKEIYVHRNTFNYRIQQFIDKTGVDIKDYKNSLLFYYYMTIN